MRTHSPAPTNVDFYISRHQNIYHASAIYAGLDMLVRRHAITLSIHRLPPGSRFVEDQGVLCMRLTRNGIGGSRHVAIDLFDQNDLIQTDVLEQCDVYFKRSYYPPALAAIDGRLRAKIKSFGLNFAARTSASARRVLSTTAADRILDGLRGLRTVYDYLSLPLLDEFERLPTDEIERTIVFQTRIWPPDQTAPGEAPEINGMRVNLVRQLRDALGNRFRGGLVPTPHARANFPDALTPLPSRRRRYVKMSAQNLIGIYTRGLHQSTAFKMAEYLAASQCIVSEVPCNELPLPLRPGVNFLPFETPAQCVEACWTLLSDSDLSSRMRVANRDYYWREVEPANHMLNVIEEAFQPAGQIRPAHRTLDESSMRSRTA